MSSGAPRVAVVIPTKNAGPHFERTLGAIANQRLGEPFEIVVIDSGSSDRTLERCRAYGAKVIRIQPEEFGHGRTRNYAISQCRGEYVALTVQDAVPANEYWLRSLVAALDSSPRAAGAYSRQLPDHGAGFIARQVTQSWHRRQGGRVEQRIADIAAFERLPWKAKQFQCTFNNVSSIVRRSVWERHPFREIPFAEDLAWGYDVLRAGHSIIYEPASVVHHSHERSLWYELRRAYVDAKVVGELLGALPQPLSTRQLAYLCYLWPKANLGSRAWSSDVEEIDEKIDLHREEATYRWFRHRFSRQTIVRLFGEGAPYSERERLDLLNALEERFHSGDEERSKRPFAGLHRVLRYLLDRRLDWRISRVAWADSLCALSRRHLRFIFDCLWSGANRDDLRGVILDQVAAGSLRGIPSLEMQIQQFVDGLVYYAVEEGSLTPKLYRDICRYEAAVVIGRRLGAASRYGAGAWWLRVVEPWFQKGI